MKGYFSWILVFASVLVLTSVFYLIQLSAPTDQSKIIILKRAELIDLNFKDVSLELLRQGVFTEYTNYNDTHNVQVCSHCEDYGCILFPPEELAPLSLHYLKNPPQNVSKIPLLPSYLQFACYEPVCPVCFRLEDAKRISRNAALERFHRLDNFSFSEDFTILFDKEPDISIILNPNPLQKNGYELVGFKFNEDFNFKIVSQKFNFTANSKIPKNYQHNTSKITPSS